MRRGNRVLAVSLCVSALLLSIDSRVWAIPQTFTATSLIPTTWSNLNNWNPTGIPATTTDAIIPGPNLRPTLASVAGVCASLTMSSTARLDIIDTGTLTVGNGVPAGIVDNDGTIVFSTTTSGSPTLLQGGTGGLTITNSGLIQMNSTSTGVPTITASTLTLGPLQLLTGVGRIGTLGFTKIINDGYVISERFRGNPSVPSLTIAPSAGAGGGYSGTGQLEMSTFGGSTLILLGDVVAATTQFTVRGPILTESSAGSNLLEIRDNARVDALDVGSYPSFATIPGSVLVTGPSVTRFSTLTATSVRANALTISNLSTVKFKAGGGNAGTGYCTDLNIPVTTTYRGTLDITDHGMVVDYVGTFANSPIYEICSMIISGYASGAWNGTGIRSSLLGPGSLRAIGFLDTLDPTGSPWPTNLPFLGAPVDAHCVLIRYTLKGDTDLDADVDFADLLNLAQGYNMGFECGWWHGDFDYDHFVGFNDLLSLAQNYGQHLLTASELSQLDEVAGVQFASDFQLARSMVPEPAMAGLLAATIPVFARRRRMS